MEQELFDIRRVAAEKTIAHVAFWAIILVDSLTAFGVLYSFTSPDFRIAMEKIRRKYGNFI